MVECSEVENINFLKVDGVARKAKIWSWWCMQELNYKKKMRIDR